MSGRNCIVAFLLMLRPSVNAQLGQVGINTTTAAAMLNVMDSSVLFTAPATLPVTPGGPPVSGPGNRMMWYADKASFRAGSVNGTQWNKDSIGLYSVAMGLNTKARGMYSFAAGQNSRALGNGAVAIGANCSADANQSAVFGSNCEATGFMSLVYGGGSSAEGTHSIAGGTGSQAIGDYSVALGYQALAGSGASVAIGNRSEATGAWSVAMGTSAKASGVNAVSIGFYTEAKGNSSAAFGANTLAKGQTSTAMGRFTIANGYSSTVVGMYNDSIVAQQTTVSPTTPLFIIGNGDENAPSNALVVRKDGQTGLGTNVPARRLHVSNGSGGGLYSSSADMILEDDAAAYMQFSTPNSSEAGFLSGNAQDDIRSAIIFRADSAIDLRTGGNVTQLRIEKNGDTDLLDGELQRTSTGSANLVPVCYGMINSTGVIQSDTGNFSVTHVPPGRYDITITGESYISSNYSTSVSPVSTSPRMFTTSNSASNLVVYLFDAAGVAINNGFQLVVYKQ